MRAALLLCVACGTSGTATDGGEDVVTTDAPMADGSTTDGQTTTDGSDASGAACAVEVAGGYTHTCARKSDGSVSCWGANNNGQVGDGTMTIAPKIAPTKVMGFASAAEIAAGTAHTCAQKTDGTVWCWGQGINGQLGDGTNMGKAMPVQVQGLANVVSIASGYDHACAAKMDGTLWCWGAGTSGQLGDGMKQDRNAPVQVTALANVVQAATSQSHTCARKMDGTVWCWGSGTNGHLGDGTTNDSPTPVQAKNLTNVVELAGGWGHTCARKMDGTLSCWGDNGLGQLGIKVGSQMLTANPVTTLGTSVARIAAGYAHTCARKTDDTMVCWGGDDWGQLGIGMTTMYVDQPGPVMSLAKIGAFGAGALHTCAFGIDGALSCWGRDKEGQLGDGTMGSQMCADKTNGCKLTPTSVAGLCP